MQVDHMLCSAKKTTPMPLNCQTLPLAQAAIIPWFALDSKAICTCASSNG
jgi:hypothetical protein